LDFSVIIPARYQSTRLPGKPLIDLAGKSMIQRVYEQAQDSDASRVVVATDDGRIASAVEDFGGSVCMTSSEHLSGTDRLQEVCSILELANDHIVINVQGDEPLIPPAVINQVANNLNQSDAEIATLSETIDRIEDFLDPNIVKVISDKLSHAIYFSRAPIPWPREAFSSSQTVLPPELNCQRHLGIYAYRVSLLNKFIKWPAAAVEEAERLEQLRALWHGVAIHIEQSIENIPPGVDTESDLKRTLALLEK
jgi:3-deoxy-manno-octulosonate cytidylyltransferase (CMP-KDO synthetase)